MVGQQVQTPAATRLVELGGAESAETSRRTYMEVIYSQGKRPLRPPEN
jgi:hypothetical protein